MESLKSGRYSEKELKHLCDRAKFRFPDKMPSISAMKQGLILANKIILSGNSKFHKYMIKHGWTEGWVDYFCEHRFKDEAKILIKQESVADHSNIRLSP